MNVFQFCEGSVGFGLTVYLATVDGATLSPEQREFVRDLRRAPESVLARHPLDQVDHIEADRRATGF